MADSHYPNAPIVEATIDLQVAFDSAPPIEAYEAFAKGHSEAFPSSVPIQVVQLGAEGIGGQKLAFHQTQEVIGIRMTSRSGSRVLQIQPKGFTYSHMPPYSRWSEFLDEALPLWSAYARHFTPKQVVRVALRYINRIQIPKLRFEFDEYFKLYPQVPSGIPEDVGGFFMQLQMPQSDLHERATAIINMAGEGEIAPDKGAVLLDFDVFVSETSFEPSDKALWQLIEVLRQRKNLLFEASITDNARALFR